jgi:hypothetical protein
MTIYAHVYLDEKRSALLLTDGYASHRRRRT